MSDTTVVARPSPNRQMYDKDDSGFVGVQDDEVRSFRVYTDEEIECILRQKVEDLDIPQLPLYKLYFYQAILDQAIEVDLTNPDHKKLYNEINKVPLKQKRARKNALARIRRAAKKLGFVPALTWHYYDRLHGMSMGTLRMGVTLEWFDRDQQSE
jgi:hypothetical protein